MCCGSKQGSRPLWRENFNITDTVNQVKQVLQPLAQASKISITTEVAADVPSLEGDPHLIAGALLQSPEQPGQVHSSRKRGQTSCCGGWKRGRVGGAQSVPGHTASSTGSSLRAVLSGTRAERCHTGLGLGARLYQAHGRAVRG